MENRYETLEGAVSSAFAHAKKQEYPQDCLAAQRYIIEGGQSMWEVSLTEGIDDSLTHISDEPTDFKTEAEAISLIKGCWDNEWDEEA